MKQNNIKLSRNQQKRHVRLHWGGDVLELMAAEQGLADVRPLFGGYKDLVQKCTYNIFVEIY